MINHIKNSVLLFLLCCALEAHSQDSTRFKANFQMGAFLQLQGLYTQDRPTTALLDNNRAWSKQLQVWRARLLANAQITPKTSFFVQTEIASPIGVSSANGQKNIQTPNIIILDAQIEHKFAKNWWVYVGKQLVGINRQGLQSPVSLMGLEYGWYQYPYNLFANQPLQNDFGRDIGVSTRGYALDNRLELRLGVFRGRAFDTYSPLRTFFRFNYNFLDREEGHYYTGTNLGKKKTIAVGGGAEAQTNYTNIALDAFVDLPVGELGSLTAQASFMRISVGNSVHSYSFTAEIPNQTIVFGEVGFFFKKLKLQPYLKYEKQAINITDGQYTANRDRLVVYRMPGAPTADNKNNFNVLQSNTRIGGGLNYYVQEFNFHVKLQYEQIFYGRFNNVSTETKSGGEVKLQVTCFLF